MVIAVPHSFVEQTTEQTFAGDTYTDVPGMSLASGNFVAGRKYLILATIRFYVADGTSAAKCRMVHGSTAFAESEHIMFSSENNDRFTYQYFTVWTAISGEGIKMQGQAPGAPTWRGDNGMITSIELSEVLQENTDWFFDEDTVDLALSGTAQDGASVTFTPNTAGEEWLVMSLSQGFPTSDVPTKKQYRSRVFRVGGTGNPNLTTSEFQDLAGIEQVMTAITYNLAATSTTIKEQSLLGAGQTGGTRLNSKIFVLRLNKFSQFAEVYTPGLLDLGTPLFGNQLQTLSITPDAVDDYLIFSSFLYRQRTTPVELKHRWQIDNVDQPPTQTADEHITTSNHINERTPHQIFTIENLDTTLHTIDIDASASNNTGPSQGNDRLIVVFRLAVLFVTRTKTFSLDGILKAVQQKIFTINARLINKRTKTFLLDGILQQVRTKTFLLDAVLKAIFQKTFSLDAVLKIIQQKTFSIDAILRNTFQKTFALDGVLKAIQQKTFSIDARLVNRFTKTFSLDAFLKGVRQKTFSVDAILQDTFQKIFTLDAFLAAVRQKTFAIDARLVNRRTKTFLLDGILQQTRTKIYTLDAILKATFTKTFSLDGFISLTRQKTFTIDAQLFLPIALTNPETPAITYVRGTTARLLSDKP